jgi:uncharacterized protein (TIGR04255 family)
LWSEKHRTLLARMSSIVLTNKPLVEAILEIRWAVQQKPAELIVDPHARLLPGLLFTRFNADYPVHEPMDAPSILDELPLGRVQHRFRAKPGDWPLVQLGQGVLTLNDTKGYSWDDFKLRAIKAMNALVEQHPAKSDLKFQSLNLRYIDAIAFNPMEANLISFLKEKLKIGFELPKTLFDGNVVADSPDHFGLQARFPCTKPRGRVVLSFGLGRTPDNKSALLLDTQIMSDATDIPNLPIDFENWISNAHTITHDWFFKLIDGDLLKQFK